MKYVFAALVAVGLIGGAIGGQMPYTLEAPEGHDYTKHDEVGKSTEATESSGCADRCPK